MRDDRERIADILEAVARIEKYAARGREAFDADELIQIWIVHHLQVIGEACFAMSQELRNRHPSVPWDKIIGMRHILVHEYFGIDREIVWSVVTDHLSALKKEASQILTELPGA